MCKFVKVSRSGYYEWLNKLECSRDKEDKYLTCKINDIFIEGRGNYGCRPIKAGLAEQGLTVSRRRIARLMSEAGLNSKLNVSSK